MQIKEMFVKKIDREIQGVIIVGQGEDSNVSQELEEYVVTRELQKHFADFYSAYKKGIVGTTPKMGVWISGFFGSGKSHFLKILSYLLENRQVGSRKALDYFIEDKKIVDSMVLADMKLAAETPTDVILFNIDSKSESTGKQNKDAIVNALESDTRVYRNPGTGRNVRTVTSPLVEKFFEVLKEEGYDKAKLLMGGGIAHAMKDGDPEQSTFMAGQSAGSVVRRGTCREIIERMMQEAREAALEQVEKWR